MNIEFKEFLQRLKTKIEQKDIEEISKLIDDFLEYYEDNLNDDEFAIISEIISILEHNLENDENLDEKTSKYLISRINKYLNVKK